MMEREGQGPERGGPSQEWPDNSGEVSVPIPPGGIPIERIPNVKRYYVSTSDVVPIGPVRTDGGRDEKEALREEVARDPGHAGEPAARTNAATPVGPDVVRQEDARARFIVDVVGRNQRVPVLEDVVDHLDPNWPSDVEGIDRVLGLVLHTDTPEAYYFVAGCGSGVLPGCDLWRADT